MTRRTRIRLAILLSLTGILLLLVWPLPRDVRSSAHGRAVQITDREGRPLYELRDEDTGSRRFVTLAEVPATFLDALIAIEDRRFYRHGGVSIRDIARAIQQNLSAGYVVSGGSTLTQQLIRIRLAPDRRTVPYKVKEALFAWKLEWIRSKGAILEAYVNEAYFGHQAYGIDAAARTYFAKSARELSLAESALLAGLVQSPSALDPFANMEGARKRQALVLSSMRDTGVITVDEMRAALGEPLTLSKARVPIRAPHFALWLPDVRPDAFKSGREVRTTIDLSMQTAIERIVERRIADLADKNVTSAAVVVLDARNGDLLAMVGSADYFDEEHAGAVNVALSPRQPGSTIKPFTYALALARGDTAATTVADVETQFFTQDGNPYVPRNYDYGYHGLVRYREALANSYNIAAVKVLEKVGVPALLQFLKSAGITTLTRPPEHYGLALTLGDAEVTLLDLAAAYGMFARGGRTLPVRLLDSDPVSGGERILDEKTAWIISDILSDETARLPEFGEDSPLSLGRGVAAKTGTTRNSRDNWVIGYTPDVVVGIWVGNADNSPMRGTSGVTGAGPIFHDVLEEVMRNDPPGDFPRPPGLEKITICRMSGKLPTDACPHTMEEWFVAGTKPVEHDDVYRAVLIDARNGLLAPDGCPAEHVIKRTFAMFPEELQTWARENGWQAPPVESSPLCFAASGSVSPDGKPISWLSIEKPQTGDSFKLDPLIPDDTERVVLKARASGDIRQVVWFVNGVKAGEGNAPDYRFDWQPHIGSFVIEARAGTMQDTRKIEVVE